MKRSILAGGLMVGLLSSSCSDDGGSGSNGTGGTSTGGTAGTSSGGAAGSSTGGTAGTTSGGAAGSSTGGAAGTSSGGAAGTGSGGSGGSTGGTGGTDGGSPGKDCTGYAFVASCKVKSGGCSDYYGSAWTVATVKSGCETGGNGTMGTSKCDATGNVGACVSVIGSLSCTASYSYPPVQTTLAQQICTGSGGTFYPP